jgi:hypothetical protein
MRPLVEGSTSDMPNHTRKSFQDNEKYVLQQNDNHYMQSMVAALQTTVIPYTVKLQFSQHALFVCNSKCRGINM